MVDDHSPGNRNEEMGAPPVPFAIPLAYETARSNPLAAAARALGLVCVLIGTLSAFVIVPLSVLVALQQRNQIPRPMRRVYFVVFVLGVVVSFVLHAFEMIAGIVAIRLRPSAVWLLLTWGWSSLVWALLGSAANIWYILQSYGSTRSTSTLVYAITYTAERQIAMVTVPLVALMLLRSHSFRSAFSPATSL